MTVLGSGALTTKQFVHGDAQTHFWDSFYSLHAHPMMFDRFSELKRLSDWFGQIEAVRCTDDTSEEMVHKSYSLRARDFVNKNPEFAQAFEAWLESCGLNLSVWAFDQIFEHLEAWNAGCTFGTSPGKMSWTYGGYLKPPSYSNPPTLPRFNPERISIEEYESEAHAVMMEYMDTVLKEFEACGLVQPIGKKSLEHFDWLVRFQVLGQRPGEIADELRKRRVSGLKKQDGRITNTITDGIKSAARLTDLQGLRGFQKGR
jgi:hypothetical protein